MVLAELFDLMVLTVDGVLRGQRYMSPENELNRVFHFIAVEKTLSPLCNSTGNYVYGESTLSHKYNQQ